MIMSAPKTALTPCPQLIGKQRITGDSPEGIRAANCTGRARGLKPDANGLALANNYREVCHAVATEGFYFVFNQFGHVVPLSRNKGGKS